MPSNAIIVLDSYFNLTNISILIDRLKYNLIRFFDNLEVAYFFGPPCTCTPRRQVVAAVTVCLKRAVLSYCKQTASADRRQPPSHEKPFPFPPA